MYKHYIEKPLDHFLSDFPDLASILYFYGIDYSRHTQSSLVDICRNHNLSLDNITNKIGASYQHAQIDKIASYPLPVVLKYLKQAHRNYIKHKIPFCLAIVKRLETKQEILGDIKFIFPVFAEDFVSHIIDEENTVFKQIATLLKLKKKNWPIYASFQFYEQNILKQEQEEHLHHNEFKGFRDLTSNYNKELCTNLEELILVRELELFDIEIRKHAHIENNILFPKALRLLDELKNKINTQAAKN